jgi:DNA-binding transcriptional LysR family regulator
VLDEYAVGDYPIQAIYTAQRYVPAKVHAFIEFLRERYQQPHYWDGSATAAEICATVREK